MCYHVSLCVSRAERMYGILFVQLGKRIIKKNVCFLFRDTHVRWRNLLCFYFFFVNVHAGIVIIISCCRRYRERKVKKTINFSPEVVIKNNSNVDKHTKNFPFLGKRNVNLKRKVPAVRDEKEYAEDVIKLMNMKTNPFLAFNSCWQFFILCNIICWILRYSPYPLQFF